MSRAFSETYVTSEIINSFYSDGKIPPIYYYRDDYKKEIDVIIEQDGTLYPMEIKKSGNPKKNTIKNFDVFEKRKRTLGMETLFVPIDKNNYKVPVWLIYDNNQFRCEFSTSFS